MWITYLFNCECGESYEEMITKKLSFGEVPPPDDVECPACGSHKAVRGLNAPAIAAHSIMSREMQMHSLKERSRKHSEKMNKSNMDEIREKMNNGKGAAIG